MSRSTLAPLHTLKNRISIFCGQHRARRELMGLSDHALADIGLRRTELPSFYEIRRQVLISNLSGMR